jgi:hypothetical protein
VPWKRRLKKLRGRMARNKKLIDLDVFFGRHWRVLDISEAKLDYCISLIISVGSLEGIFVHMGRHSAGNSLKTRYNPI